jgi:hypothetical protein
MAKTAAAFRATTPVKIRRQHGVQLGVPIAPLECKLQTQVAGQWLLGILQRPIHCKSMRTHSLRQPDRVNDSGFDIF